MRALTTTVAAVTLTLVSGMATAQNYGPGDPAWLFARSLSARAFLIIAAVAFLASCSKVLASAFWPVAFFCGAVAAVCVFDETTRATAKTLSERQSKTRTKFLIRR